MGVAQDLDRRGATVQLPGRRINGNENLMTPWFPRGGDSMLLRILTLKAVGSGVLSVKVETKNEDDPTGTSTYLAVTPSGTSSNLSTTAGGFMTALYLSNKTGTEGTRQQVRLVFGWSGASDTDYYDIQVLAPGFFDAGKVN